MKRAAETLFNFPVLYRAKFFFTGLLMKVLKPVIFRTHFTLEEVLCENVNSSSRIFEIGCGDGANFRTLKSQGRVGQFCGVDVNAHMVEYCRERHPDQRWLLADRPPYPLDNCYFDTVLIVNVLHHLENREMIVDVLREASRLGKRIMIFEPLQSENIALYWLKRFYWLVTDGGNLYLRHSEFQQLFADAGLAPFWEKSSAPLRHFYAVQLHAIK